MIRSSKNNSHHKADILQYFHNKYQLEMLRTLILYFLDYNDIHNISDVVHFLYLHTPEIEYQSSFNCFGTTLRYPPVQTRLIGSSLHSYVQAL